MRRRSFLQVIGSATVGIGLGLPRLARASSWGDVDPSVWPAGITPATNVLEIYLWGGMAPWESFYFRPGAAGAARGFDADVNALIWNTAACPGAPTGLASQFLAKDKNGAGKDVHLGPFAKPLWRSDIRSRTRVVVMQHDLVPHEAAVPYALSGRRLGRPDATGLGAPLQRRARGLDPSTTHPLPFAYCLVPSTAIGDAMLATLDAVGNHGGNAKPIVLPIGTGIASFLAGLNRTVPDGADALIAQYTAQYGDRLKRAGGPALTRSAAFADYASSTAGLEKAPSLSLLLGAAPLSPGAASFCTRDTANFASGNHFAGSALRTAAYLLNHPDPVKRARYVGIVDGGLDNSRGAYDVHSNPVPVAPPAMASPPGQAQRTSSNLWETLSSLAQIIRAPGDPPDPMKIDLQTTLIVIKTEFGRTPFRSFGGAVNANANGRDHWPDGYASVLIGGPIQSAGVSGSISDGTGSTGQGVAEANWNFKPQDVQAAALLAAGIDPFSDGNLAMGDLTPSLQGASHSATMVNLRQTLLGVA